MHDNKRFVWAVILSPVLKKFRPEIISNFGGSVNSHLGLDVGLIHLMSEGHRR